MFRLLNFIVVCGFYDAVVFFRINLFDIYFAIENFFFPTVGLFRINLYDISFARDNFFFAAVVFFRINLFDIRNSDKANYYATNNVYKRDGNKDIVAIPLKKVPPNFKL